jgi:hypothetical protein
MDKKTYYQVVSVIFLVVGLLHLARIFYGWEAIMGGVTIPMWFSWAAVLIASYLTVRGWQFAKKR